MSSILTRKPITSLSMSSGTSQGKPKSVPFNGEWVENALQAIIMSFAFRNRDEVHAVSSIFAHSNIVQAFRTFELVWEELVTDIRQGTLSERITGPPVRSAVKKLLLKPDPELANMIYDTCLGLSKLNWYGLIQELFPNTKYVYGIMTGSMEPYVTKLMHYAGEGLPLLNGDYVSSEAYIAVNVNPKLPPQLVTFTPLPNSCYYEFIPIKQEDSLNGVEPHPVGLTEVKVGDEYEIILTAIAGLYRYRLGDVIKVKGFHNSDPELQFIRRKDLLLSINIAKHTEKDLQVAVESAAKLLAEEEKQEVINFTSHVNSSTEPGHYVIFWELSGEANNETLKECCNCLDKSFAGGYILSRRNKAIGPLELRIVKSRNFHKIIDHYVGLGAAANQFKSQRCVGLNNTAVLQILSSNVVKSYFSTAY